MTLKTEIAIIGGGPAGSAAAIQLSRIGYHVHVFERARFPRDKVCGEYLNPAACHRLNELGVEQEDATLIDRVCLHSYEHTIEAPLFDQSHRQTSGFSLRRLQTDYALVKRAQNQGAILHEGFNVRRLLIEEGQVIGLQGVDENKEPFECYASLVIAADGSHSIAARQLKLVKPLAHLQRVGVVAHFKNVQLATNAVHLWGAHQTALGGVAGFAPQSGNEAILSMVLPSEANVMLSKRAPAFVWEQIARFPHLSDLLGTAELEPGIKTTACFGHKLKTPFAPGILFAGDAACFIDPFTGEGVHHALLGGMLAAQSAHQAFQKGDFSESALAEYARQRQILRQRYALCELIQLFTHRPRLFAYVARNLRKRPWLAERLMSATADLLPPAALLPPKYALGALNPF